MTWTAQQTVDWFMGHATNWWGPNTDYASPFTRDLGRPGEYGCADAVTDTLLHAGIDIRQGCPGYYNCINLHAYMLNQPATGHLGFKTVDITEGRAGDVVLYVVGGVWGHTGMLRASTVAGTFYTIENDTSSPSHPSWYGCGVCTPRDRLVSEWVGRIHVFRPTGYATSESGTSDEPVTPSSPFTRTQTGGLAGLFHVAATTGTVVKALQTHINTFHGGELAVDGSAGPLTITALQHVLDHLGAHLDADGVFGPLTSAALSTQIKKGTI